MHKVIESIETNLKKLELTANIKQIENAIQAPIKDAFMQSNNKAQLFRQLSLTLHPDKLTQRQDGIAHYLRLFLSHMPPGTDLLSLPQKILQSCSETPCSDALKTSAPAPVYTSDPDRPGGFRDADEILNLVVLIGFALESSIGIPYYIGIPVILILMAKIKPQEFEVLHNATENRIKMVKELCCFFKQTGIESQEFTGKEEELDDYVVISHPGPK